MFSQVFGALLRGEVVNLRRWAFGFVLLLFATLILAMAAGFACLSLFLALAAVVEPWLAALIVGLVIALLGLVIGLVGRHRLRRQVPLAGAVNEQLRGLMGRTGETSDESNRLGSPLGLVVAATLIGMIVGQKLKK